MNDKLLRQDVLDELEYEPSIDAADIGVSVEDGIVTLSGHVKTYAEKATAEETVLRVKGVKGIAQKIEVRPAGAHKTADDEIAKRAANTLSWNSILPDNQIKVKVQNGWITLTGEVEWQYQKAAAENSVKGLNGVYGVHNDIKLKPHASVPDIKKRIEDALKRTAELEAKAIRVDVVGDNVMLEGKVNAWAERTAAERAAWSAPGVRSVQDRLVVK